MFETEMKEYLMEDPVLSKLATPRMEAYFDGRIIASRDRMFQNMQRSGWTGEKMAYKEIMTLLENSDPIFKKSKMKKKLLQFLADGFREIHEGLLSGKLDPSNIEGGIHELCRDIRQLKIIVEAFPGMFILDESLEVTGITLSPDAAEKAFTPKDSELLKRPVSISYDGYLYILEKVKQLGKLKGKDGMKEYVTRALGNVDLGAEAKPLLREVDPTGVDARASFKQTRADARALFTEIKKSKILLQLADQFEEAKEEF